MTYNKELRIELLNKNVEVSLLKKELDESTNNNIKLINIIVAKDEEIKKLKFANKISLEAI